MVNHVRTLMVKDNLVSMYYFQVHGNEDAIKQISVFVKNGMQKLPWFYRIPVKLFMVFVGIINIISLSRPKNGLSAIAKKIPFYNMANKLIRTMSLMILFDVCPIKTDN